ncbi:hypothetical protein ACNR9V_03160 [Parageobacillus thermoglucosidasius]|uniref:hypothetical protein n=1 Tax=Parageobacillus thermoglucosidasius TaxID=1426 RepID=UPI003B685EEC
MKPLMNGRHIKLNKERMRKLEISKAVNIAVGCVMASSLDVNEKREVIESLRKFERQVEEADAIERFLARLRAMAGTGNGIGETTVRKIRAFAEKEGFISPKR